MLLSDEPELTYLHPRSWARLLDYDAADFHDTLAVFKLARQDLLRVLTPLSPEAWRRSGIIKGRAHTVFSQTRRMALHEEGHWPQLDTLMAHPA